MKVVINTRIGGFTLSISAIKQLIELNSKVINSVPQEDFGLEPNDKLIDVGDGYHTDRYTESVLYKDGYAYYYSCMDEVRNDPILINVIENLGEQAAGFLSSLKIVEIPDDIEWYILELDDGTEQIHEKHRVWV